MMCITLLYVALMVQWSGAGFQNNVFAILMYVFSSSYRKSPKTLSNLSARSPNETLYSDEQTFYG